MNKKLEWIDAEDFFKKMVKKAKRFLLFYVQLMFIVFLILSIASIYYLGMDMHLGLGLLFPFAIFLYIFAIGTSYYDFVEATRRREIDKYLLECRWCNSYFSQEIWKEITRYLRNKSIEFTIEAPSITFDKLVKYEIILKKKGINIAWYGPYKYRGKDLVNWVSIGILNPKDEESISYMELIKEDIKSIMEKMPNENPFCSRCSGKKRDVCYGGMDAITEAGCDNKMLAKIDPYKDEVTLKYLIDRKERLDGKWPRREDEKKLSELADTTETYQDIVYK